MLKRKFISIFLFVFLISNFTGIVYAKDSVTLIIPSLATSSTSNLLESNAKISKEEATKIAVNAFKDYFNIEIDEKNFQSSCKLNSDYQIQGYSMWNLNWNSFDKYGYIALAKGLSVIDSNSKLFNPKELVKMEEFSHTLYNIIQYVSTTN
jgi:hypothetical protein